MGGVGGWTCGLVEVRVVSLVGSHAGGPMNAGAGGWVGR